jgi:hypothetical protein
MPFVLVGLALLAGVGITAILVQRAGTTGTPGAGPALGATQQKTADPPGAPTTSFQSTSPAEPPDPAVALDPKVNENPDRWMKSPAATTTPIGINQPEDPFIGMDAPDLGDRNLGYAIDDLTQQSDVSMFEDDIERPADLAYAPAAFNLGRVAPLLR